MVPLLETFHEKISIDMQITVVESTSCHVKNYTQLFKFGFEI